MKKRKLSPLETGFHIFFLICGILSVAFVLFISIYLIISGLPAILKVGPIKFLFGQKWAAGTENFGILSFILTSIYGTAGAVVIGVPLGIMTAVFLAKVAPPKLAKVIHTAVELLAGIPSVVYGLVGMVVLVPAIQKAFKLSSGACLLAAILVLAVMILPYIINVSETALGRCPGSMRKPLWRWAPLRRRPISKYPSTPPAAVWPPQWCRAWAAPSVRLWPSSWCPATWPICPDCSSLCAS